MTGLGITRSENKFLRIVYSLKAFLNLKSLVLKNLYQGEQLSLDGLTTGLA